MPRRAERRAWEDWAHVDPLWAILTAPDARGGRWDEAAFFESGRVLVEALLDDARRLGRPETRRVAVDFGCGVGRLTRALAPHFETTYGLDIAPTMIEEAVRFDGGVPKCVFVVHQDDDLRRFDDGSVDFVSCLLVLQHLPSRLAIETYLREFVRVLSPGGVAVFQLPTHVPVAPLAETLRGRLAVRQRVTRLLRAAGMSRRFLYDRLRWRPDMPMLALPEPATTAVIADAGGSLLKVAELPADHGGVSSSLYFAGR
jgi:SAM-dependent methyltransferase